MPEQRSVYIDGIDEMSENSNLLWNVSNRFGNRSLRAHSVCEVKARKF